MFEILSQAVKTKTTVACCKLPLALNLYVQFVFNDVFCTSRQANDSEGTSVIAHLLPRSEDCQPCWI
jgi:hypothetical protein